MYYLLHLLAIVVVLSNIGICSKTTISKGILNQASRRRGTISATVYPVSCSGPHSTPRDEETVICRNLLYKLSRARLEVEDLVTGNGGRKGMQFRSKRANVFTAFARA